MTQLLLIRHAHNDWLNHRLAGWTPGIGLNEEGHAAAAKLAQRLADLPIDAVYSSPLQRAVETAAYLARPRGLPVVERPEFGEVDCGNWTGRTLEELASEPLWAQLRAYPSGTRLPGGETLNEVHCRAVAGLDAIVAAHSDQTVAIVSHADVIKVLVAHCIGLHLDFYRRLVVAPASLTVLEVGGERPELVLLNDTGAPPRRREPSVPPAATSSQR